MTAGQGGVSASDGTPPLEVSIRLEVRGDAAGIRAVELAAFSGPEEADIVDRIRDDAPDGWRSLVAADPSGCIVGHLLMTPCPVQDDDGELLATVLAIGPVAVDPEVQGRGVGSALMAAAMSLAVARVVPALVLLGHPSYYPRFGFESARGAGLEPPAAAWPDAAWMARLLPAWTDDMAGTVRYHEAFEPLA
ncbi:MAG TPA: N-acetyltransferase [Candidatus Limnocylindrales bacterium]|jgi:putative acetyltransferase